MRSFLLSTLALGGALACAQAHAQWEFHAAAGMRQADMREMNRDGARLVQERGSLPGIEVGALEWDHWRRDIEGRGAVLGLRERYDAWRLLGGAQIWLGQWPLGSPSLRGLLVLSAPERMPVRFEQDVFGAATLDTSSGVGARLALGLSRIAEYALDVEANYEWLRVARSEDAPLRRNGLVAGSLAQPEHAHSGFGIKTTYRF